MEGERGQGVGEYLKAKGNGLSRIERNGFSSSSTSSDVFRLESENGEIPSCFYFFFLAYQALHGTSRAEASTSGTCRRRRRSRRCRPRSNSILLCAEMSRGRIPSPDEVPEKGRKSKFLDSIFLFEKREN